MLFAIGLGISGFLTGAISMFQMGGIEETLIFYTLSHLLISAFLWGNSMANFFDGKKEWRARFHLDEYATNRLGKSVIRVGISLPYVVLFAFAPREEAAFLAIAGGSITCAAAWGMSRMRSWAIPAFAIGAVTMLVASTGPAMYQSFSQGPTTNVNLLGTAAALLIVLALIPLAGPTWNFLRGRDSRN